ncbi:tetratricopeptide repeat protein [Pedobacter sp. MC2016-14]|uniref:ATP-binding protein n=1 Tax=Pedobacter sp. MC2016-14 TaxID=2897327 RepID=UPI001E35E929|nr:ATP-binding protein [Pedobacter sp. MC2016-14]MCD0488902.1 tetratricopeptide repeat protein [Pedobacter sp. MC2016-14]
METIDANKIFPAALLNDAYNCRTYDLKQSISLSLKALRISTLLDDKLMMGRSNNHLSLFYMIRGDYKRSIKLAKTAISYFEELNDEKGIADANFNIASVYYKTDHFHLGLVNLSASLSTYRKLNDYHNQARVYKSLGTIYEYFGDQKNALSSYENAIFAARRINDLNLISNAYNPLSGIYLKNNKVAKAFALIEKSIAIKNKTGDVRGLAFAIYGRAKVYIHKGLYELAELDFKRAIEIHLDAGEKLGLGMAYQKLGYLYMQMGKLDLAKQVLEQALEVSNQYNIAFVKFRSNYLLYQIAKQQQDTVKSLAYLELYLHQKEAVINMQTLQVIESYEWMNKMQATEQDNRLQKEKADITEKKDRAEQTAQMKQNFLSTMSHEIRTPLNAVTTITSLLIEKYEGEDKVLLDSLKAASGNLLLVINDILDFTKLDNGKVVLEPRPCELRVLLQQIIKTYENLAIEKGLQLTLVTNITHTECFEIDETKLSQILGNLVSNAIKYTEVGNVVLEANKLEQVESVTHDVAQIRFKVTDTGLGIPKEYFAEMFESFSQPKSITTRKQGGTGLGLAIVKKLVEIYGSQIHFDSAMGRGSVFYFDVNLKSSNSVVKLPVKAQHKLKNKSVLLAEDNMINAMVAKKLLGNWGISTVHAVNGLDVIEKAKSMAFDFILMDIHMPEMNGLDATAYLRANRNLNQQTPIFALTADITIEALENYRSFFTGFLRKPIEIDKLYEALSEVDH